MLLSECSGVSCVYTPRYVGEMFACLREFFFTTVLCYRLGKPPFISLSSRMKWLSMLWFLEIATSLKGWYACGPSKFPACKDAIFWIGCCVYFTIPRCPSLFIFDIFPRKRSWKLVDWLRTVYPLVLVSDAALPPIYYPELLLTISNCCAYIGIWYTCYDDVFSTGTPPRLSPLWCYPINLSVSCWIF